MALIKCSECGKEISDRASSCMNCGCPIEKEKKPKVVETEEKEILSVVLNIKKMRIVRYVLLLFGIIFIIFGVVAPLYAYLSIFGIVFFLEFILFKKMENNKLILTNKRIKGSLTMFFTTKSINIPLERVDNILVNKDVLSTGIIISSNNVKKGVGYVLNADEFADAAMKEIEKYKNR